MPLAAGHEKSQGLAREATDLKFKILTNFNEITLKAEPSGAEVRADRYQVGLKGVGNIAPLDLEHQVCKLNHSRNHDSWPKNRIVPRKALDRYLAVAQVRELLQILASVEGEDKFITRGRGIKRASGLRRRAGRSPTVALVSRERDLIKS